MKIALTSTGPDLDADLDPRFGRAAYFVIVDPDTLAFETVANQQSIDLPQGAGIQAGKTVVDRRVSVLITGNCGPKAYNVLNSGGVAVITGAAGTLKDVLEQYRKGQLKPANAPNVDGHWM